LYPKDVKRSMNGNKLYLNVNREKLKLIWHKHHVVRYFFVGSWNALFSIVFLYILFYFFDNNYYEYELAITFIVSAAQSYATQRILVWKSSTSPKAEFLRFLAAVGLQYILNSVALYLAVDVLNFKPKFSALPIMVLVTCGFYFVNRNLVFKKRKLSNALQR
jgi:putative flippase GtrA